MQSSKNIYCATRRAGLCAGRVGSLPTRMRPWASEYLSIWASEQASEHLSIWASEQASEHRYGYAVVVLGSNPHNTPLLTMTVQVTSISSRRRYFCISSPFQCFVAISMFRCYFNVSLLFQCFITISMFRCYFNVLSPFQCFVAISMFHRHFNVSLLFWCFVASYFP